MRAAILAVLLAAAAVRPAAAQDVPTPPHPRLFLDGATRTALRARAGQAGSRVAAAVERCTQIGRRPADHARDKYMGLDWAGYLQTCLVAWAATGDAKAAATAMTYFVALIDDLDVVGDGKGGDASARRDSGFAIRALGPYTALAYDWLHDHPAMTEEVRARARQRFEAWTTWYLASGYRARSPSTNYHAGYLVAATLIAIAQNGEAGPAGNDLWRLVRDQLWDVDMKAALAPGGVLDGGDWGEGWQYGPLSVAEYALAARAMAEQGHPIPGVGAWLDAVVRRHVHALSPGAGTFAGGDTQHETANLPPRFLTLAAVVLGGASPDARAWAAAEIDRLRLTDDGFPLYGALADAAGVEPRPVPRADWPTAYLARGVGTFYARTSWGAGAVWLAARCSSTIDVDHVHPDAGNLVLSRGADDLLVDPTPYGSLSSLTSNAPTVESAHLPRDYKPSQAFWSKTTGFAWARQTTSGVVALRCDYADQYRFQHRPSDVPAARRDLVVIPWDGGASATAVVVDRAASGDRARGLHLRFRAPGKLTGDGARARVRRGGSALTIQALWSSGGTAERRSVPAGSCFADGVTRGGCDAARFPVGEWRHVVPGPTMAAAHLLDLSKAGAEPAPATVAHHGDLEVITARRGDRELAVVVGGPAGSGAVAYQGPADAIHVVVDAPPAAVASARPADGGCAVTVTAGAVAGPHVPTGAAVFTVDGACAVAMEADRTRAGSGLSAGPIDAGAAGAHADAAVTAGQPDGSPTAPGGILPRSARRGCCGAQTSPTSPLALTVLVAGWWLISGRRRRSRDSTDDPR